MADPTIQTFCCHRRHFDSDIGIRIMGEFNTTSYNTLCLMSSIIGIIGAIVQILPIDERLVEPHRTRVVPMTRGRKIIIWLAVADLFASFGVFIRSIVWIGYKDVMSPEGDNSDVIFCVISSAWIQYFYMATWLWTLCYAIEAHLIIKSKPTCLHIYHTITWGLPAVLTATGLTILYYPDANCSSLSSISIAAKRILPNYCATYIPIAVVMIANPIIYAVSCKDLDAVVALPTAEFTSRERRVTDSLKLKFLLINVVFYLCWLPNLINGILLWTLWFELPVKVIVVVWYIMAFTNPLQAFFNALLYRRWISGGQKLRLPFSLNANTPQMTRADPSPHTPLLNENLRRSRLFLGNNNVSSL